MALAQPARAWRFALIATVASVLGGMLGYAIGAMLYDTVGQWLSTLRLRGESGRAEADLRAMGVAGDSRQGLDAHPLKLVTIASGLLGYSFPLVRRVLDLTGGRGSSWSQAPFNWFGEPLAAMERNFAAVLGGFVALVVVGFVIAIKVF